MRRMRLFFINTPHFPLLLSNSLQRGCSSRFFFRRALGRARTKEVSIFYNRYAIKKISHATTN